MEMSATTTAPRNKAVVDSLLFLGLLSLHLGAKSKAGFFVVLPHPRSDVGWPYKIPGKPSERENALVLAYPRRPDIPKTRLHTRIRKLPASDRTDWSGVCLQLWKRLRSLVARDHRRLGWRRVIKTDRLQ